MGVVAMSIMQTMRGRIIDLRRLPTCASAGAAASVLPGANASSPFIPGRCPRGIVNWSTGMSVNYRHVDPAPLLQLRDFLVPALLVALVDQGLLLSFCQTRCCIS
jgi:hypothetical protein